MNLSLNYIFPAMYSNNINSRDILHKVPIFALHYHDGDEAFLRFNKLLCYHRDNSDLYS